jgi:hypothetical protein
MWWISAVFAGTGVPVIVLDELVLGGGVSIPAAHATALNRAFVRSVEQRWPEAVRDGRALEEAELGVSVGPLLHFGIRVGRWEVQDVAAAGKREQVLRVSLTPFALDLAAGEVVASRPYAWLGVAASLSEDHSGALVDAALAESVDLATRRFAEVFSPTMREAKVIAEADGGAWVDVGRADGAYVGARFRDEMGSLFQVDLVGEDLSFVRGAGGAPPVGVVRQPGAGGAAVSAPRVMVVPTDHDPWTVGWAEDALAGAGWRVIPASVDLPRAQLAAASRLSVADDALLSRRLAPDVLAVPLVWSTRAFASDDALGTARISARSRVSIHLYDATDGTLIGALDGRSDHEEDSVTALVPARTEALRWSTPKVAFAALSTSRSAAPPERAERVLVTGAPGGVTWPLTVWPAPPGTLGEVRRIEPVLTHPVDGRALYGPESLVGVARVEAPLGSSAFARWVFSRRPVARGDVFVATRDDRPGPVDLGRLSVRGLDDTEGRALAVARAGLLSGSGLAWRADPGVIAAARGVERKLLDDGVEARLLASVEEDRGWTVEAAFEVSQREVARGARFERVVRVDVTARVLDAEGAAVLLRPPSAAEGAAQYTMWTETSFEARLREGERSMALLDGAVAGQAEDAVHGAAQELVRRLGVMLQTASQ